MHTQCTEYFCTWRLSPPERNARFLKCIQIYRCKHFVLKQFFCFAAAMVVKMRAQLTDQMTMRKRKTDSFCIWQQLCLKNHSTVLKEV